MRKIIDSIELDLSTVNDIVYNHLLKEGAVPEDAEAHRFRLVSKNGEMVVKIDIYGEEVQNE